MREEHQQIGGACCGGNSPPHSPRQVQYGTFACTVIARLHLGHGGLNDGVRVGLAGIYPSQRSDGGPLNPGPTWRQVLVVRHRELHAPLRHTALAELRKLARGHSNPSSSPATTSSSERANTNTTSAFDAVSCLTASMYALA
jgi:hypothetical protein